MQHWGRNLLLCLATLATCMWIVRPVAWNRNGEMLPLSCPEIAAEWAKWLRSFPKGFEQDCSIGKHVRTARRTNSLGCAPYQLLDDFSWVHRANASWVPTSLGSQYRRLLHRAAQNKQASLLRCKCRDPFSNAAELELDTVKMILFEALCEEARMEEVLYKAEPLVQLTRGSSGNEILMVGNSASLQDPGTPARGTLIDSYPVVVRFNLRWREDMAPFVGWKRDVWVANDYHDTCGCLKSGCCTPEQEELLWQVIGSNCSLILGKLPPPGMSKAIHANVQFATFGISASTINYWLWLEGMQHPEFQTLLSPILHTRTGMQTIFLAVASGLRTTIVGFDIGNVLHRDLYQVIDEREGKNRAYAPLRKFRSETNILIEMVKAGLLHVLPLIN
eukprot:jgi/Mesvir1/23422/Mv25956-RA.1